METKKHVFTHMEKKVFIQILKKYSSVIENKNNDGATLRIKNDAWARLTEEFNASPLLTSKASKKQLRRLWINIKQRLREARTKERQDRMAGGGSSIFDVHIDPAASAPGLVGREAAIDSDTIEAINPEVTIKVETDDTVVPITEPPTLNQVHPNSKPSFEKSIFPVPPTSLHGTTSPPFQSPPTARRTKNNIWENEYDDRLLWATEKHNIEMDILREQLREAKAKADLAELVLRQRLNSSGQQEQYEEYSRL